MPVDTGVLAALGSAASWALASTLMATQSGRLDPTSINGIRMVWAAVFFGVILVAGRQVGALLDLGWWNVVQLAIGATLGLGVGDTLYVRALTVIGLARAFTVSLGLYTVFTFTLSAILFGEDIGVLVVIGSGLVLASVYVVSFLGRSTSAARGDSAAPVSSREVATGLVLIALVGLCWATATVWTRSVAGDHSAVAVGSIRLPAAALVVFTVVAMTRSSSVRRREVSRRSHAILALAGVIGTGLGALLFIYALQHAGAGRAAVISSASPLFALPLGVLVLREPITRWVALGAAMGTSGIALLSL